MKTMVMRGRASQLRGNETSEKGIVVLSTRVLSLLLSLIGPAQRKWRTALRVPALCLAGLTVLSVTLQAASAPSPNFVLIRGGEFIMGSPANEVGRQNDENQHRVKLGDFYMSKYPVTVAEFRKFIEATNFRTDAEKQGGSAIVSNSKVEYKTGVNWRHGVSGLLRPQSEDNHPVLHVSWNDAVVYSQWMSKITGKRFRLPTEAEREYASRAGSRTPFNTGDNITPAQANYDGNYSYNNQKGEYRANTVPVNALPPNAWGLYNMHGNVFEWCSDLYGAAYYDECNAAGIVTSPSGPAIGARRVLRGGAWNDVAQHCRSAYRNHFTPDSRGSNVSFRLVLVP